MIPSRAAAAFCCLFAVTTSALLAAEPLGPRIDAVIDAPRYAAAHWGLLVVDRKTGETLYEHQAGKLFAPASVTKVFTVAGALDALGADFKFETPVYARGKVLGGLLLGDLVLRASGDLAMGGRTTADGKIAYSAVEHTYANFYDTATLTDTDPLAGLAEIARQIKAAGIERVQGDVLIDDSLFEAAEGSGSGPGRITPILVNDNVVDLTITPTEPGEPAKVAMRPFTGLYQVEARIQTTGREGPLATWIKLEGRRIIVDGTIPAGHAPLLRIHEVADPRAWARGLLIEQLVKAGVAVDASPTADYPEKAEVPNGKNYAELKPVAKLVSPPLSEFLRPTLKLSHNLWAGTLPLIAAAKGGRRTLAEGMTLERALLEKAGVNLQEVSFNTGAGGGRADFATPRATVTLLRHMATRPDIAIYEGAMPILGIDGTLAKHATPDNPAYGKIRAKTGTLVWNDVLNGRFMLTSKALAGYATTTGGRELVFAAFVNNVPLVKLTDTEEIGRDLGKICEEIVK